MTDEQPVIGIFGGAGLTHLPGHQVQREFTAQTPYGETITPLQIGEFEGRQVAFLSRQESVRRMLPEETTFRANIYAMKQAGVEYLISFASCGSLREDYEPGDIFIPNQIMDLTHNRRATFFGNGCLAHVNVANPFCPSLSDLAARIVRETQLRVHTGGALLAIEGPRFSTRAEANTYRSWGMSAVNMSLAPEPFLAREAEICYTSLVLVTDYDVWHISDPPVTAGYVTRVEDDDIELLCSIVSNMLRSEFPERGCECATALQDAITTPPELISQEARERLGVIVASYLEA